jgi:cytochrome c2
VDEKAKAGLALAGLLAALVIGNAVDARLRGPRSRYWETRAYGDPDLGRLKLREYGCGSCHAIEGVPGAGGRVGPALAGLSARIHLAGRVPNTPANLAEWIRHPQRIDPGTAMPDTGVTEGDAGHMVAYLYTLD